jgi:hypothetical protein
MFARPWLAAFAAATLLLLVPQAHAEPLRYPKRAIGSASVDLAPLFRWWTNHLGERPLVAWVHVSGAIVGTNSLGWIVEGTADRRSDATNNSASGNASNKFVLKTPPLADRTKFEDLLAQRAELEAKLKNATGQTQELTAEKKNVRRNRALSNQLNQNISESKSSETGAKDELRTFDKQFEPYGVKPGADAKYKVDCFALDLQQEQNGLRVYDHGHYSSY